MLAEVRRGGSRKMACSVCRFPGKYIGCTVATCPKGGHYPCLVKANYLFQHYDAFVAFCPTHAPTQPRLLANASENCCICLGPLYSPSLYCPSCTTYFHKDCVQVRVHTSHTLTHHTPSHRGRHQQQDGISSGVQYVIILKSSVLKCCVWVSLFLIGKLGLEPLDLI